MPPYKVQTIDGWTVPETRCALSPVSRGKGTGLYSAGLARKNYDKQSARSPS